MANIMSRKDVKNKVHRSGFDLSHRVLFTQKTGEVLPVSWYETLPGDKFNINLRSFLKTVPFETAAFARLRQYIDVYFVPYRLLWKQFPVWFSQTGNSYTASDLTKGVDSFSSQPYLFSSDIVKYFNFLNSNSQFNKDLAGLNRWQTSAKLLECLGYGDFITRNSSGIYTPTPYNALSLVANRPLNIFPLLAYQKVCDDFFRFKEWTKPSPWRYNLDFISKDSDLHLLYNASSTQLGGMSNVRNMFDMNYCQYDKDLFNGLIPEPQYGDEAAVPVVTDLKGDFMMDLGFTVDKTADPDYVSSREMTVDGFGDALQYLGYRANESQPNETAEVRINDANVYRHDLLANSQFGILSLRYGEMLQKWKEITISADPDFADQIYAHWNEHVSHYASQKCRYLGGISSVIDIQEIINSNLAETGYDANSAGVGRLSQDGHIEYDIPDGEVGVVMVVTHVKPVIEWNNSDVIHPAIYRNSVFDYPIPEFDSLGMEAVRGSVFKPLSHTQANADKVLGYAPRYISFKTNYDRVMGGFRFMPQWTLTHAPANSSDLRLNSGFFTVTPHITDNLFLPTATALVESDLFYNSLFLDVKIARNLDYDGLPY